MKPKRGVLSRVASKTVAVGRQHAAKLLEGKETLAEAAGATVKGLFSPTKKTSVRKNSANNVPARSKVKMPGQSTSKAKLSTDKAKRAKLNRTQSTSKGKLSAKKTKTSARLKTSKK